MNEISGRAKTAAVACFFAAGFFTSQLALAAPSDDANAVIHKLMDSFNSGDYKAFGDGFVKSGVSITDEYAPHLFAGASAVKQWSDAFDKDAKAKNITDPSLPFNPPSRSDSDGKTAYVIMPSTYGYKQNGTPMAEEGTMTFVLNMTPKGWKIRAFTWTGASPHPVK